MSGNVPMTLIITSRPEDIRRILNALEDDVKWLEVLEHDKGTFHNDEAVFEKIRSARSWCVRDNVQGAYMCTFPAEQILGQMENANRGVFSTVMYRLMNEFDRVALIGPNLELAVIKERPIQDINEWRRFGNKVPDLKPDTTVADVQRVIDAYCVEIAHTGRVRDLFETVKILPGNADDPITISLTTRPEHHELVQRLRSIGFAIDVSNAQA